MPQASPDARGFAKKTVVSFATHTVVFVANLAAGIAIARVLGPDGKGAYALIMSLAVVVSTVAELAMTPSVTFHVGRYKWPPVKTVMAALGTSWGALAILLGLGAIVGPDRLARLTSLTPETFYYLSIMLVIGLPLRMLQHIGAALLRGRELIVETSWPAVISSAIRVALLTALLLAWRRHLASVIIADLAAWALWAVLIWVNIRFALRRWPPPAEDFSYRKLLSYGLQNQCTGILELLFGRADIFLINFMIGQFGVGIYSLSVNASEMAVFGTLAITTVVFPRFALLEQEARREWAMRMHRMQAFLGISFGATVVATCFLIPYIYGGKFQSAVLPAAIRVCGSCVWGCVQVMRHLIVTEEKVHAHNAALGVALLSLISLDWFLIPRMGITGAAIAYAVSVWAAYIVDAALVWRLFGLQPWRHFVATREDLNLVTQSLKKLIKRPEQETPDVV